MRSLRAVRVAVHGVQGPGSSVPHEGLFSGCGQAKGQGRPGQCYADSMGGPVKNNISGPMYFTNSMICVSL